MRKKGRAQWRVLSNACAWPSKIVFYEGDQKTDKRSEYRSGHYYSQGVPWFGSFRGNRERGKTYFSFRLLRVKNKCTIVVLAEGLNELLLILDISFELAQFYILFQIQLIQFQFFLPVEGFEFGWALQLQVWKSGLTIFL